MKKHNKMFRILLAALLVCLLLAGCGKDNTQTEDPSQTQDPAASGQAEVTAANEEELRSLLAQDGNLLIRVAENMEVREGFTVNGTKTLTGDAELKMALGAELGQALLEISENSSLTLNGPVLDCNFNADGIFVGANATLTSLSGTILNAGAYGILAYGDVTVEDIRIEDCEFISICAQTGSRVYIKGGSVQRSASNDVYVVNGAYVNISGDTVMEGALEHAMINYGTLEIHDGKFGNVNNYLCDNYGELIVAYEGEEKDGTIEFYGARNSIFLVRKGSTASFSNVYIHDTERQGIASLGGDTTIVNCTFEKTGNHSIDIQGGKATVKNVTVTGSLGSGLEASNASQVTVTNFTVNSCEKIGIASRGASITASNLSISNTGKYGLTCGDTKTGQGVLTVKDAVITKTTSNSIYVYDGGSADLQNVAVSDGSARGIYVAAKSTCKISGESSFKNMGKGGAEVRGTLELNDVTICDNNVKNSGAGIYVADSGSVTLNGGAVYNNSSALRGGGICVSGATLTVSGAYIYSNWAANHGGGIYVQNNSLVSLKTGQVTGNRSAANGDGIYILSANSQVKVAENFYLGGNDIKVDNAQAVLKFTGKSMVCHSASDPVLLTPNYNAPEGTVVAICNSEEIANKIAVASGDGSYEVEQSGRKFVVKFAQADMDMSGADTVTVSSFEELKAAVEGTTGKRNIVLASDILFPERIRLPGGVTINILDDGTQRTLTRADGFTDSFFVTHYGTGLYLTGTAKDMLVLDGTGAEGVKNQSLIRVSGSTELKNVVLRNNGSLLKEHDVRGALVRQLYGDIKILDSTLSGGEAYSGGALMIDQGTAYISNSVLSDNESTIGGGAIRVAAGCQLEVVGSRITGNHAGSTGGGIVAVGASKVTATNTSFENNTAASYGGAVSAQDPGTQIILIGTDGNAVVRNNSSVTAGAVYAVKESQLEISGYTFESNHATDGRAGAICVLDGSSAAITGAAFYGNTATGSGGALVVDGSKAALVNCDFGKENAGNKAGDKGGAILLTQSASVEMKTGSMKYNTAAGEYGGGAVYVDANSTLKVEGYAIESNSAVSGGAIYVAEKANVVCVNDQFTGNQTTSKNGGAVYCAGTFKDTGSSYTGNKSARHGGAVIVMGTGTATMDGAGAQMKDNTAAGNGGAIFINQHGSAAIRNYVLDGNTSATGSIQVQVGASAALNDLSFTNAAGRGIYVNGSITFSNLTGVQLVKTNANAKMTVNGYQTGNVIEFTPKEYKAGVALTKGADMTDAQFAAACSSIPVTQGTDGKFWFIDNYGNLSSSVASIVADGVTNYFDTLAEAVAYANANGGEGKTVEITVLSNASVEETLNVSVNVSIVNAADKTVTVSRGSAMTADMFAVKAGGTLALGRTASGALIIDGDSASNIDGRTVTVESGATFTLRANATLKNATSKNAGAAIQTAGAAYVYGTIRDNVSALAGAAMDVAEGAKVQINGASFIGNRSAGVGGAIRVNAGAEVTSHNARFENNRAVSGNTYSNGGAIYCAGKFTDTNSSYIGNAGKNGGAIIVMGGGDVTLTGTDAAKAVMTGNTASVNYGGAIFVNGGKAAVTGYKLDGNTGGGVQVQAGAAAALNNVTLTGEAGGIVCVNGSLTVNNVTGAHIIQAKSNASITLAGYQAGNVITFTPASYESKAVLTKADAMAEADFAAACDAITVTQSTDGKRWIIDRTGTLAYIAATVTVDGVTTSFTTLEAAVAYANGKSGPVEVIVITGTSAANTIEITGNVAIVNAAGQTIQISRGSLSADMFLVKAGGTLMLGRTSGGALIINGASTSAVSGRTVTVESGATFTLNANATLQNAYSKIAGAAISTAGTTNVYGAVTGNKVTGADCAGLDALKGAVVEINGAVFSGNTCESKGSGAALAVRSGATVTSNNASYTNNVVPGDKNGGAIYNAGTFTDTNSSYSGNQGKNGGAIFVAGGTVTLNGGSNAVFTNNTATGATDSRGGAIFVNGGSVSVTGCTFTGNTSTGTKANTGEGAIHIANGGATLKDVVFQGAAVQKTYVLAGLTVNNVTGAHIVQAKSSASITVSGYQAGNVITFTPASYESRAVLTKADAMAEADFAAACAAITVPQVSSDKIWYIDGAGNLTYAVAGVTMDGVTVSFKTLEEAVAYANSKTGPVEIELLVNVTVYQTVEITGNVAILNAAGQTSTISRGSLTADMFLVKAGGALTLGGNGGGALIVDGTSASAVDGRTVTVESGATFTLNANATLQNAYSKVAGAAISTEGNTYVYGIISGNKVTGTDCAGLDALSGAVVTINGGVFSGNTCESKGSGAALAVRSGATVTSSNANYTNNVVPGDKNGGAIYCVGTFTDTNSTYTGNKAKNGGAIFLGAKTAVVTMSGTNAEMAVFKNNQAVGASTSKGGALYNNGGTLTVNGYTFTNNTCQQSIASPTDIKNAQIWSASGKTTLTDVTVN